MEYRFNEIEKKWQDKWKADKAYKVFNDSPKPKYYVLDMFPYPSGAGLHVGHPLGYIASDIYSRYKRLKGFNVLHPMGFDSFGLPAEQYAIETGQHPAETTKNNIATFKAQLDKIGFCYDWDREVSTSDPQYYKWTQWIFLEIFNSYFDKMERKAKPLAELENQFKLQGNIQHQTDAVAVFSADEWKTFDHKRQQEILMEYRLAFSKYGEVNWCEKLGTVLANDEVVNGVSERGGHPVVKRKMRQWYLRITDYADRLLEGLEKVDFSDSMKEMQRNWIGKSQGAEIDFAIKGTEQFLKVYTTRPDTIFGVDFMVVAPELNLVQGIKSAEQATAVAEYIAYVKSRSDVDRMAEKKITGCFTGAYAINPFSGQEIPIYISEYVLAGYGTGAIMAVPCGDDRDFKFAQHFNIPVTNIIGAYFNEAEANATKEATLENSGFLNGMKMMEASEVVLQKLEEQGMGKRKVNYRMRDAGFSRQRYWGEPFPIIWTDGVAIPLNAEELPLELPHVDKYGPGPEGEGPLANISNWANTPAGRKETSTMPGYAGSSWYFLRYMDPQNSDTFCDRKASDYWNQVDLYIGGTEHAVGHLLYSRLWTKVLFDLGKIGFDEPFRRLVNQGMITGISELLYRYNPHANEESILMQSKIPFFNIKLDDLIEEDEQSKDDAYIVAKQVLPIIYFSVDAIPTKEEEKFTPIHIDIKYTDNSNLDLGRFTKNESQYHNSCFVCNDGFYYKGKWRTKDLSEIKELKFKTKPQPEKMSKRYLNVVNPNDLCNKYGADTFRMYEMFLGPVEASKPWDTKGIEGVHRFLRKLWRLFFDDIKGKIWTGEKATDAELKILHRTIKKIEEDTERFSFNTAVSAFMICVNDLFDVKCHKKEVLEKILILLVPYAPHIAEELWQQLDNVGTILDATYPTFDAALLVESSKEYPISINGKVRANINLALNLEQAEVEKMILQNEVVQKWLEGKVPKKIIYVKNKMVNVVV